MTRVCGDSFGECCFPPSAASPTATIAKIILVFLAFITALTSISTYLQYGIMAGHYTIAGASGLLLGAVLIHCVQMIKGCHERDNTIHTLGEEPSKTYNGKAAKGEINLLESALLKIPNEIKSYFTAEKISSFPSIDDVKLNPQKYPLGTDYFDRSMLKLLPKFAELNSWCLIGQDSAYRWMFLIKVTATEQYGNSREGLIIIHQRYNDPDSIWTMSAFGKPNPARIADSLKPFELMERLLKGETLSISDAIGKNPITFSLPKPM